MGWNVLCLYNNLYLRSRIWGVTVSFIQLKKLAMLQTTHFQNDNFGGRKIEPLIRRMGFFAAEMEKYALPYVKKVEGSLS